jgi:hypothetical protein
MQYEVKELVAVDGLMSTTGDTIGVRICYVFGCQGKPVSGEKPALLKIFAS